MTPAESDSFSSQCPAAISRLMPARSTVASSHATSARIPASTIRGRYSMTSATSAENGAYRPSKRSTLKTPIRVMMMMNQKPIEAATPTTSSLLTAGPPAWLLMRSFSRSRPRPLRISARTARAMSRPTTRMAIAPSTMGRYWPRLVSSWRENVLGSIGSPPPLMDGGTPFAPRSAPVVAQPGLSEGEQAGRQPSRRPSVRLR